MKERVEQALNDSLPNIVEALKTEVSNTVSYQVKNEVCNQVTKTVTAWINENLAPEIQAILVQEKEGLLSIVPKISEEITSQLAVAMAKSLSDKLGSSWERKQVLEALFK